MGNSSRLGRDGSPARAGTTVSQSGEQRSARAGTTVSQSGEHQPVRAGTTVILHADLKLHKSIKPLKTPKNCNPKNLITL